MPVIGTDQAAWRAKIARIESLGYGAVSVSDHMIGGWSMDVVVAMTAAVMASTRLHVLSLVMANDYRHPAFIHRAIASLDVLSGGRVELGIGTGWWAAEYEALGLRLDPPAVRVARLEASLEIIDALFRPEPVDFEGDGYRIRGLVGRPGPVRSPRPPILVGGGSAAMLALAGRRADIAGVFPPRGADGRIAIADLQAAAMRRRVDVVRAAATAHGRAETDLRFQLSLLAWAITAADGSVREGASSVAPDGALDAARQGDLVGILTGTVDEACQRLEAWRAEYGFSEIHVGDAEAFAPIIARLAGR